MLFNIDIIYQLDDDNLFLNEYGININKNTNYYLINNCFHCNSIKLFLLQISKSEKTCVYGSDVYTKYCNTDECAYMSTKYHIETSNNSNCFDDNFEFHKYNDTKMIILNDYNNNQFYLDNMFNIIQLRNPYDILIEGYLSNNNNKKEALTIIDYFSNNIEHIMDDLYEKRLLCRYNNLKCKNNTNNLLHHQNIDNCAILYYEDLYSNCSFYCEQLLLLLGYSLEYCGHYCNKINKYDNKYINIYQNNTIIDSSIICAHFSKNQRYVLSLSKAYYNELVNYCEIDTIAHPLHDEEFCLYYHKGEYLKGAYIKYNDDYSNIMKELIQRYGTYECIAHEIHNFKNKHNNQNSLSLLNKSIAYHVNADTKFLLKYDANIKNMTNHLKNKHDFMITSATLPNVHSANISIYFIIFIIIVVVSIVVAIIFFI